MAPFALSLWWLSRLAAPVEPVEPVAPETEVVAVPPASEQALAPVPAPVVARPAAWVPPPSQPLIVGPPTGKWMRVSGGLAVGLGALLGVAALASYAVTDGLERDDVSGRRALEGISLGLGIAAVAHLGAGVPLLVIGKQRQRRHQAWARRVSWQPRLAAGPQGVRFGLTLRF